ncbi:MAG TPA: hypothetical protein VMW52_05135 [Phycisphaerae bacterium]|nr:hypothetical protein [Phycisphaerae bacterium]
MSAGEVAVVVLVVALSFSCVAIVGMAVWILARFSRQLSLPAELAMRFPYRVEPDHYAKMGVGDQLAAGRESVRGKLPYSEGREPHIEPTTEQPMPMMEPGFVPPVPEDQ